MFPITWRLYHGNALCNLYMMLPFVCLCVLGWVTTQFCMEWCKAQVFIPWRSNSPTNFRWNLVETVTQHNAQYCLASCLRKKAAKILVSPSSWGRTFHCPCRQVLIKLISWVQSWGQPLCPGNWSMHNCLTSQHHYHQLFLFADPLERG